MITTESWTPLLSGKAFEDFSPCDFIWHVRNLYFKPPKKPTKSKKKPVAPFSWRLTAKGTLVIRVNRKPKMLTRAEVSQIASESKVEERLVWVKLGGSKKTASIPVVEEIK